MNRLGLYVFFTFLALISFSQRASFDIKFDNIPLDSVLKIVTVKTGYYFSYNTAVIPKGSLFTMNSQEVTIDEFLNKLLVGTDLLHQVMNDQIIIKQKAIQLAGSNVKPTFIINGQVSDSLTHEPISGVNVFLSGTNLGGVTDLDGYYTIERIPLGSYEVIFSHVTYGMKFKIVELFNEGVLTVNSMLLQESKLLDTVEVLSRRLIGPENREKYLKIFKNEFLGRSVNSTQCELLNPDILDFIYDPGADKLEVFALEPVQILNNYLGYHITYYFDLFQKTGGAVNFHGRALFRELTPFNDRDRKKWLRNRRKVYDGSFLQFRRALVNDRLKQQQFRVSIISADNIDNVDLAKASNINRDDILNPLSSSEFELRFDGFLLVTFKRRPDEGYLDQFFDSIDSRGLQRSLLTLNEEPVILKANGRMEFPGLATFGYWYWERIGDLLPENYDPESNDL